VFQRKEPERAPYDLHSILVQEEKEEEEKKRIKTKKGRKRGKRGKDFFG
jgi:hypothetical protein